MRIILASSSPRRKELLEMIGMKFETIISNADETLLPNLTIEEQSKRLAYIKAKAVFDKTEGDRIVIGSDTMVVKNGKLYGKPHTKENAIKYLQELRNGKHEVVTSICVLCEIKGKYKEQVDCDVTEVTLKPITDEEIMKWIDTNKAYDKAGGYAVQSEFSVYIEKINGNFFSTVGLPIHKLYDMLKNINDTFNQKII